MYPYQNLCREVFVPIGTQQLEFKPMAITKGKKIAAGASVAGLVVALTAAITPSAFAAAGDIDVTIDEFDDVIIAGAPEASSSDVDNQGEAVEGTWQYPGNGKATAVFSSDFGLNSNEALAGRVTVTGDGIGDAWDAHDVADANPYDFWFRFRDEANGQGGQYEGDDFRQVDADTLEMASVFNIPGPVLEPGMTFLDGAQIQVLSNLDWYGDITLNIEFLAVPAGTDDPEVPDANDVTVLGSDSITSRIIPALEIDEQPLDVTAKPGDDVSFTSSAVSNTNEDRPNHIAQDDILVGWMVSANGGQDWDGNHDVSDTTLALTGVTEDDDGNLYRAMFSAGESSDGDFFNFEEIG